MSDQTNPFLDISDNIFMKHALAEEQDELDAEDGVVVAIPTCGDPTCMRAHRPAHSVDPGAHYDKDNSTRTKQLIDDGKMGGQFGHLSAGRAKRNKRAAEIVADYAVDASDKIKKAFADGLADTETIGTRQATALALLKIEADEHTLQLKEREQAFNHMTKTELVEAIMKGLTDLQQAQMIADGVIDVTAVEIGDDDD